jgi:hypothetical protein
MSAQAFLQAISSTALRNIASHWVDIRGDRIMPSWNDIRPAAFKAELPIVWALTYDAVDDIFRIRLVGDRMVEIFPRALKGTPLDTVYSDAAAFISLSSAFKRVASQPSLLCVRGPIFVATDRYGSGQWIAMPLSSDGQTADGILGATEYTTTFGYAAGDSAMLEEAMGWFPLVSPSQNTADNG